MTGIVQRFVNVKSGEGAALLASAAFHFFVLTALMVLRPARESLGMESGLDTVRLLFIGTAVVTLAVNPVFGFLVSRLRRLTFISATYLFFASSLVVFYLLLTLAPNAIGMVSGRVFYVWYSVFNLFNTMVFWALMADRYSLEQSKRLFGVIAAGGTVGAIVGPFIATQIAEPFGTPSLILVAVGSLIVAVGCAWLVTRLQPEVKIVPIAGEGDASPAVSDRAVIGGSAWEGFRAVMRSRYLQGISGYMLIVAVMATFLYFTRLKIVADMTGDVDAQTAIFAQADLYTQLATLALQLVVAGHMMRWIGVPATLALLPFVTALGFVGLAMVASFASIVLFQAAFNAVQRAIMRPARETLFTVVDREEKYKAKAFTDTFVYRLGDVIGAQVEGLLAGLSLAVFALGSVAVPLAGVWGVLGIWLGRSQAKRAEEEAPPPRPLDQPAPAV